MQIVCLDLEGVLIPEIWIEFPNAPAYRSWRRHPRRARLRQADARRIEILNRKGLGCPTSSASSTGWAPRGARGFLDWLRGYCQVGDPFRHVLPVARPYAPVGYPTLFCNELNRGRRGACATIVAAARQKRESVRRSRAELPYHCCRRFYNDTAMLAERMRDPVSSTRERDCRVPAVPVTTATTNCGRNHQREPRRLKRPLSALRAGAAVFDDEVASV